MTATTHPHIIPLVRKLRDSGVSQSAAEAIGEAMEQVAAKDELAKLVTKEELRAELANQIAASNRHLTIVMLAVQAVGIGIIAVMLTLMLR